MREGVSLFYLEKVPNLGDDLSPSNVALKIEAIFWRKSEWNFGRNCSNVPPLIWSMSST